MKCSSRKNCKPPLAQDAHSPPGLNEVQLPKELQREALNLGGEGGVASMKCSSRRNCNPEPGEVDGHGGGASMKCSSRRNCNLLSPPNGVLLAESLNEVQLPKELQHGRARRQESERAASMKCSSRRNCNRLSRFSRNPRFLCLNEVQLPKELQRSA